MSYRVLIVDDNRVDAKLMVTHLERSEYDFGTIKIVQTRDDYMNELKGSDFDLIISDYRMKNFNGLEAIRLRNKYAEHTPLIVVSGTIGDENAVELIKEGAVDFLLKDSAAKRLAQVSIRAILESNEKKKREKAETSLQKTLNRYRMLFESSRDGIIFGDPKNEGKIIDANKAICDLLGYIPDEMKKLKRSNFVVMDVAKNETLIREREAEGQITGEMLFQHKNGTEIPVEVTSSIIEIKPGVQRSFSIIRDIRERKKIEERRRWEQRKRDLQNDIAQIINQNTSFEESLTNCVKRIKSYLEWSLGHVYYRNDSRKKALFESIGVWSSVEKEKVKVFKEATESIKFHLNEGIIGEIAQKQEFLTFNPTESNGFIRQEQAATDNLVHGLIFPVIVNGQTEAVLEFFAHEKMELQDYVIDALTSVTEQISRLIERKRFIDELQDEKNLSEQIINSLPGVFFIISEDLETIRFNMKLEGTLNYTHNEVLQMHPLDFVIEEDKDKAFNNLGEAFKTGEVETELKLKSRDGKVIPFLMSGIVTELRGQRCLLGTGVDIKERLRIERELRTERDFIERAINSLPGLFYVLDENNKYERVNQNFLNDLGYSWEELNEKHPLDFYQEKDHQRVAKAISTAFKEGSATLISQLKTKDGRLPWYYLTGSHFNENGKDFILGTGIDITERKKLEDLLQQAHELARIGAWELDLFKNELNWTSVTKQIHEVDLDYEPSFDTAIKFYKEGESRKKIQKKVKEAIEKGKPYDVELQIVTGKRNVRWVRSLGNPEFRNGKCIRLYGSFQDIHEQKLLQEELKKSLHEKDVLLQEVHHRVKNNLALISGILQLQAYKTDVEEVKLELSDSGSRIQSIATIHELLYQSENFSQINFKSEITKLIENISDTFSNETDVEYEVKLVDIILNVNQAIPCALIVNEVLTNIYKHAFKGRTTGRVDVNLSSEGNQVQLQIKDNGVGLPENFKLSDQESLGSQLITTLKLQIGAEINLYSDSEGTIFTLSFKKEKIKGAAGHFIN